MEHAEPISVQNRGLGLLRGDAFLIFLWSRIAIWIAALLAPVVFDPNRGPYAARLDVPRLTHDLGPVTDVWARWDSVPYLAIAEHGYGGVKGSPAFYPLYPWLVGGLGRCFGGHFVLAGVAVSFVAGAVGFVLLYQLTCDKLGQRAARATLLYLAIFPMSLFLQAIYAESLLLCLTVAAFFAAERKQWWVAGAMAGLAFLTRPTGFALTVPLALLAWRAAPRARAFLGLAIAPLLFLVFPFVLRTQLDDPWAFAHAEQFWHRSISPIGPLDGIWQSLHAGWAALLQLTVGSKEHWYWTPVNPSRAAALNLEYLAYLVGFAFLAYIAWRTVGAAYGLFAAVNLAIPLAAPSDLYPLLSLPRLCVTIFPCFMALAVLGRRERVHTAICVASAILLGLSIAEWATWQWVS
jgi:Dolichyl-phosphate-mannose-protein mannosyltransferase